MKSTVKNSLAGVSNGRPKKPERRDELMGTDAGDPEVDPSSIFERVSICEPERKLMLAILQDAIMSFQRSSLSQLTQTDDPKSVDPWIQSTDREWPFSFENICSSLGMEPEYVRSGLATWRKKALTEHPGKLRKPRRTSGKRHKVLDFKTGNARRSARAQAKRVTRKGKKNDKEA